jgi:hypothetical protein
VLKRDPAAKDTLKAAFVATHLTASVEVFDGCNHGWTVRGSQVYNEAGAERVPTSAQRRSEGEARISGLRAGQLSWPPLLLAIIGMTFRARREIGVYNRSLMPLNRRQTTGITWLACSGTRWLQIVVVHLLPSRYLQSYWHPTKRRSSTGLSPWLSLTP